MKKLTKSLEPRYLLRNIYFWLLVGGTILLIYVCFIAFTFLPRSTSEVTDEKTDTASELLEKRNENIENSTSDETEISDEENTKTSSSNKVGKQLTKAKVILLKNGGWIDKDDRKITVVIKVINLNPKIIKEIISSDGVQVEIDGQEARIINSESFKNNQLLSRAEAFLSVDKFNKFIDSDEEQKITIKTMLKVNNSSIEKIINRRFLKSNKSEIEGLKVLWRR